MMVPNCTKIRQHFNENYTFLYNFYINYILFISISTLLVFVDRGKKYPQGANKECVRGTQVPSALAFKNMLQKDKFV